MSNNVFIIKVNLFCLSWINWFWVYKIQCFLTEAIIKWLKKLMFLQLKQSLLLNEDSPLSEEVLGYSGPSLRRLYTWVREPMWHFQILADICRVCVRQRGGAVISAAYTFSYHGDPRAQEISTKILTAVSFISYHSWFVVLGFQINLHVHNTRFM